MRISKWAMACGLFALVLGGGVFALVVVTGDSDRSKPASSAAAGDEGGEGGEKEDQPGEADAQRYRAEAFPKRNVTSARTKSARRAAARVPTRLTKSDFRRGALARDGRSTAVALRLSQPWVALGPAGGRLDPQIQHLQNALPLTSGRITAVVISPSCASGDCRMWLAAADGGVWRTDDALADPPTWTSIDSGLASQSIGSLMLDPNDSSHETIYAGTGEANFSFASQAGVGLYKSVNGGDTWALVPGSTAVAENRAIGAIAVDPSNSAVIRIGTAYGVRGAKDQFFPDIDGPTRGVYKSTDGGASFQLDSDLGGANLTGLELDPTQHDTVYASTQEAGVWRSSPSIDGDAAWHKVFTSSDRTQVALASHSRAWITDGRGPEGAGGEVFRVDNADQPFASVTATQVSTEANGASRFCLGQCFYDQAIAVDPAHPNTAWVGGQNDYAERDDNGGSNGRVVLRTLDGGATWNDMSAPVSNETRGVHPDLHAIVLAPGDPAIAFIAGDGGLVRTSGSEADGVPNGAAAAPCTDARCQQLLSSIPTELVDMNAGLDTLQFNKFSVPNNASGDVQGGTQDNGTFQRSGSPGTWLETIGGDGGYSTIDATDPSLRTHTFAETSVEVSSGSGAAGTWQDATGNLADDPSLFLMPLIADPVEHGTVFAGTNSINRNTDIENNDWEQIGSFDPGVRFSALARAPSDSSTLWAGSGAGDVLVSKSVDAADAGDVGFANVSSPATPGRFVTGIAVDPADPNHAWVSFSGFDANTPATPGHVFSVRFNPSTDTAVFTNISNGVGDQPVNDLAWDPTEHDLYASTDFGVLRLPNGATSWERAAAGLPNVAVFGLTLSQKSRVLYAATFGRGGYRVQLPVRGGPPPARPDTVITSGPKARTKENVTFRFRATPAAGATFTCRLDGHKAVPCSSPKRYRRLRRGRHTFSVTARNAGGEDLTPAIRRFRVLKRGRLRFGKLGGSARKTRHRRKRVRVFSNRAGLHGVRVTIRARSSRGRLLGRSKRFSVSRSRVVRVRLRHRLRRGRYVAIAVGRDAAGRRIKATRRFRLRR